MANAAAITMRIIHTDGVHRWFVRYDGTFMASGYHNDWHVAMQRAKEALLKMEAEYGEENPQRISL